VEKIVTKREVINEKGNTVTVYDTIIKTEIKDRWQEREETRREKNSDKYDYKSLIARNKFLKDSLNTAKKQSRNNNFT
ncbi:hypothetical protein OE165_28740, partial [Escherichia coli]|uniref:hypothetical protein n=1 Tax=Escherichia coli TaxID=562 RepID=UPI0021F31994